MRITKREKEKAGLRHCATFAADPICRKEHEDENASGYANNAIVDRTRSLQNRACLRVPPQTIHNSRRNSRQRSSVCDFALRKTEKLKKLHAHTEDLGISA